MAVARRQAGILQEKGALRAFFLTLWRAFPFDFALIIYFIF
jgi:hypothetical protein